MDRGREGRRVKDALDRYPVSEQVFIIAKRVEPILAAILKIRCMPMQFLSAHGKKLSGLQVQMYKGNGLNREADLSK